MTALEKRLEKLKDETLPKRLKTLTEQTDDKLQLMGMKTKQMVGKRVDPLEKQFQELSGKQVQAMDKSLAQLKI